MIKQLTPHGNSWALIIDKPILELLKIDPETTKLELSTDGKRLMVQHAQKSPARQKFEESVEKAHRRFGRMFKKLAE